MPVDINTIQDQLLTALEKKSSGKDVLVQSQTDANGAQVTYYPIDSLVESARRVSELGNTVQARQSNYRRMSFSRRRAY